MTYMFILKCALKLVEEIISYYLFAPNSATRFGMAVLSSNMLVKFTHCIACTML